MARKTEKTYKTSKTVEEAVKRLKCCVNAERDNREAAIDDLNFLNGDQWPAEERKRRADAGRPALQINLLPKFVDQVVGDERHNRPRIKVRPIDSKGDVKLAEIREGIISNIEYLSNSPAIYDYAFKQMVSSGYGAWRVLTRYTDENPFLQEIYLESIRNPFLVYLDPSAKDQNYADAKYGFVLEKIPIDDFKKKYPKARVPNGTFVDEDGLAEELWYDDDTVTIAEYYTVEPVPTLFHQMENGDVITDEEFQELVEEWGEQREKILKDVESGDATEAPQQGMQGPGPMAQGIIAKLEELGPEPKSEETRTADVPVVYQQIITACDELTTKQKVPGKFIPLVLLRGKELNIAGKNYVYSLIRNAKDPQKMVNYWNTAAAETIALAPKSPFMATPKQIEGFETDYARANVDNMPVLLYNPDPEMPGPPQRQQPAPPPVAMFEQIRRGEDNIKSAIGMFNADVGAAGSEQTGAAITARQRPGDIGTFEFLDNLNRAVVFTGKIINEMIPEVYDSERDVRLRNLDETESFVPINTTIGSAMKKMKSNPEMFKGMDERDMAQLLKSNNPETKFNDLTVGKYDVTVTTGPSYATQRQESAQQMLMLAQAMPDKMAIASDIIVKNLDFKDSDELSARLKKTLPAGVVPPDPNEPPPPPPPPDPNVMLIQAQLQKEQMKVQLEQMKMQHELQLAQIELQKAQIMLQLKAMELSPEQKQPTPQYDIVEVAEKDRRYELDKEKMNIEKAKLAMEAEQSRHQREKDRAEFLRDTATMLDPNTTEEGL